MFISRNSPLNLSDVFYANHSNVGFLLPLYFVVKGL